MEREYAVALDKSPDGTYGLILKEKSYQGLFRKIATWLEGKTVGEAMQKGLARVERLQRLGMHIHFEW